jgi:hypothetical protein
LYPTTQHDMLTAQKLSTTYCTHSAGRFVSGFGFAVGNNNNNADANAKRKTDTSHRRRLTK